MPRKIVKNGPCKLELWSYLNTLEYVNESKYLGLIHMTVFD